MDQHSFSAEPFDLSEVPRLDRARLLDLMAQIAEASYRRGFNQGKYVVNNEVPSLNGDFLQFDGGPLHRSPLTHRTRANPDWEGLSRPAVDVLKRTCGDVIAKTCPALGEVLRRMPAAPACVSRFSCGAHPPTGFAVIKRIVEEAEG